LTKAFDQNPENRKTGYKTLYRLLALALEVMMNWSRDALRHISKEDTMEMFVLHTIPLSRMNSSGDTLRIYLGLWKMLVCDSHGCMLRGNTWSDEMTQDGINHYIPKEGEQ
jgi:hypothetical protein